MQSDPNPIITAEKVPAVTSSEPKPVMQRLLEGCCVVLISGIVFLLAAQVVVRHLGWGSLLWSSEMATWLFSWSAFHFEFSQYS